MLRLDRIKALRCLGYAGQVLDTELADRFEEAAQACERTLAPRSVWRLFSLDGVADRPAGVWLEGVKEPLEGDDITAHLRGASGVVLMACTLGSAYEQEYRRRAALSPTDGLLFAAAASALVDAGADVVEGQIARFAEEQGLLINRRYSPGYGDFPLAMQKVVLGALDAPRRIGLTVTADCVLIPTKSITAVIGMFKGTVSDAVRMSCETCTLHGRCVLAERGSTCHGDARLPAEGRNEDGKRTYYHFTS